MALTLMSVDTVPVTQALARKFRDMANVDNERKLKPSRAKRQLRLIEDGDFFTPLWGSCELGGKTYRGNGNHTSHILLACMQAHNGGMDEKSEAFIKEYIYGRGRGERPSAKVEALPQVEEGSVTAVVEHFKADTREDLVTLFQRYDAPESARSREDQLGVYVGEQAELREMGVKKVSYVLEGILRAVKVLPLGFGVGANFPTQAFTGGNKGMALRNKHIRKAVKWVVETVPDIAIYKHVIGAQVCAEIYAEHGEEAGEAIIQKMMQQIDDEMDPAAAWEASLNKPRNKPTPESLLKKGRTVVKEIAKALKLA